MLHVESPKSIIVDCDAGTDDALALIILLAAHRSKKINVKAVTCVNGNTVVDNVVKNVFRTLQVCEITDVSRIARVSKEYIYIYCVIYILLIYYVLYYVLIL